jgi:N-acetylmuramoyl-L-alanine amidase
MHRIGAHTKGHNANSIGVCYVGGIDKDKKPKDTRTEAQIKSMDELIDSLSSDHKTAIIHGHNEFSAKACPSFDVAKEYGKINVPKKQPKKTKASETIY